MIPDVLEGVFWEWFQTWLASLEATPANDNPGPKNPYEGCPL
jgi:hypothetical protein